MEINKNPKNDRKYCLTIKKSEIFCAKVTYIFLDMAKGGGYNEKVIYCIHLKESYHYLEKESD